MFSLLFLCLPIATCANLVPVNEPRRLQGLEASIISVFSAYVRSPLQSKIVMTCVNYNKTESSNCDITSFEINGKIYDETALSSFFNYEKNQNGLTRNYYFKVIFPTYQLLDLE
jgi:hypothetical protein